MANAIYPDDRSAFFAARFAKLLRETRAAAEIGINGYALLMAVVHAEDETYYQRPVTFWRGQLAEDLGISEGTLWRLRKKCVAAGWLQYVDRGPRREASYWVSIPAEHADKLTGPTGERAHRMMDSAPAAIPGRTRGAPQRRSI